MDATGAFRDRVRSLRHDGVVHLEIMDRNELGAVTDAGKAADALARAHGFKPLGRNWREFPRARAIAALKDVLHRDQAYSGEQMSEAEAAALAEEFVGRFEEGATFYTNATFPPRTDPPSPGWAGSWDPLTEATFDTGIVAVDTRSAGLLWIEDED